VARVAVTGASGLIGTALVPALEARGHRVVRVVRRSPAAGEVPWDPRRGTLDPRALDGVEAVVHLAGESLAAGRWTRARKARLLDSRVRGTRLVAETLARMSPRPATLVSMSAVGIYGARGDVVLDETSPPGDDFLAALCIQWERAADPAAEAGVRVVHPRVGPVLSGRGGALAKMLPAFRLGVAGPLGGGRQWMSWIALDDAVAALVAAVERDALRGAVNVVAPAPVTNAEFTRTLARLLRRPAMIPVPALALRLLFGELADAALLASQRVRPAVLERAGFGFRHPTLEEALRRALSE
jgi:uncharacterized protein (TIGR01777 family)